MHFTEPVYRNPYWPTWPLIQITQSCTHNRCKFWKHKYGPELLVDIVDYAVMLPPIRRHPTFTETFYSVTIVLDADETISVDGTPGHIEHGSVVTSIPGEVWQFSPESQLKGFNLAFEKEFLLAFFNDPHFLDRFSFLSPDRPSPFLKLEPALFDLREAILRYAPPIP